VKGQNVQEVVVPAVVMLKKLLSVRAEVADTGRNALAAPKRGDDHGGG